MKAVTVFRALMVTMSVLAWTASASDVDKHKQPCSADDTRAATKAMADAKAALNKAIDTFKSPSAADVPRQSRWFGALSSASAKQVQGAYESALTLATFTQFYCPRVNDLDFAWEAGDLAAVHPAAPGAIFLTPAFFKKPVTGSDSQAGTFVHELTHLVGIGLHPEWYGVAKAKNLAASDPVKARNNSDNYQYYVEDLLFKIP